MNATSTLINAALMHFGIEGGNIISAIITEVIAFIISLFTDE